MTLRRLEFKSELLVPLIFKGIELNTELRCDLFIENILVVELKAIDGILPIHEAQILTYLKLLNSPIGLLINFNAQHIFKQGQKTFVNEIYRNLPE